MADGLARYGLNDNPFCMKLKPLEQAEHEKWLVRVDGFRELDEIDNYLQQQAAQDKPLFFLVTGRNGTGRTCAADYILARYRHYRQIPADRFIVPDRDVNNHDVFETFQNWLIYLHNELENLTPHVTLPTDLLTKISTASVKGMVAIFQGLLYNVSISLKNAKAKTGFGCCLEDVPTYEFITSAFKIFQKTPTVCVFTAKEYEEWQKSVIEPFRQKGSGRIIELSPLAGQHVRELVETRWLHVAPATPNPFDTAGLAAAFEGKQWPMARVLRIISQMLDLKVIGSANNGESWPKAKELSFTAPELKGLVKTLSQD